MKETIEFCSFHLCFMHQSSVFDCIEIEKGVQSRIDVCVNRERERTKTMTTERRAETSNEHANKDNKIHEQIYALSLVVFSQRHVKSGQVVTSK